VSGAELTVENKVSKTMEEDNKKFNPIESAFEPRENVVTPTEEILE